MPFRPHKSKASERDLMGGNVKGAPHALNSQTPNICSPTNPSLIAKILSCYLPMVGYSHKSSKEEEKKKAW